MVENYKEILYDNETLSTPRLTLRKFRKTDAEDVFEYGSDAETLEFLVWEGLKTADDAKVAIVNYYWSRPGFFAIEREGKCIGCIDLRMLPEHEKATFGYVLNRAFWGQGYMSEALSAVLALCFEKLELNRVESEHYVGNEGSGRVMEKCAMQREGLSPQKEKIKGTFRDIVHYGLTRDMYFEKRRNT
ncbi:MAG: GNAT family N-acetyltransferase [Defluviitaleaceae bacterium]|nr:GNAT family N-acetyltransferase [Defluviitaleaceae bacterium]